ncbi:hypothetical protein LCGC14_1930920 [marine sediment metagenome]|uniref:Uncharacterized protein n=1 Tax=marine sediment metagenome TaxID=412755 RepID=A0A0F9FNM7_9ZZZZ
MQLGGIKCSMVEFPTPNASDLADIERITNWVTVTGSGGLLMPIMMMVIWMIAFIGSISEGRQAYRGFIFANFICLILSVFLGLLGWMNVNFIYFFIILLGFGLVWIKLQKSRPL